MPRRSTDAQMREYGFGLPTAMNAGFARAPSPEEQKGYSGKVRGVNKCGAFRALQNDANSLVDLGRYPAVGAAVSDDSRLPSLDILSNRERDNRSNQERPGSFPMVASMRVATCSP